MNMRAKMKIVSTKLLSETCEVLQFSAVCKSGPYPPDGSDENNSFARWTPAAELKMTITNPNLIGGFSVGQEFYLDFTKA